MIIYKATNKTNGNVYIGKTIHQLEKRKCRHKTEAFTKGTNYSFHKAIRKYGWENFEWSIIDTAENEEELNQKEIYWIAKYKKLKMCYNNTDGGDGSTGFKHTDEAKLKMSKANKNRKPISEETRIKMSESRKGKKYFDFNGEKNPFFGKNHSEESKKKISENHAKAWIGRVHTEETKKKMSEARKKYFENKKNISSEGLNVR